jgi:glycosyltransferase involved in cell wall biosynthesis
MRCATVPVFWQFGGGDGVSEQNKLNIAVMLRHIGDKGGITVYTDNILQNILRIDQRNHYTLLLPSNDFAGRYGQSQNIKEVIVDSSGGLAGRILWDQTKILCHLKENNADIVWNPKLSVPLFSNCKTAFTMHGLEQFAARRHFVWYDRVYFTIAMRLYCRKADAIFVMSRTGKNDLQKYLSVPAQKIHVVPESYNELCHVVKERDELDRIKNKWNLPERFILFVGGIAPLKNIPALLKAYRILKDRGVTHKLVLAGFKRWKYEENIAPIEQLGIRNDVIETGFIENTDVPALYSQAECFVLPSFYEGFGLPILEAQACGCPVVISNCGAMPEVAGEGGALSFDPDSPSELADRIQQVLTDQSTRKALTQRGLENVNKYSWEQTARNTIRVLESLAGAP